MQGADGSPTGADNARAASDPFEVFRSGFPALRQITYMSVCDKMILHDAVRRSINVFLDRLAMASANRIDHEVFVERSRAKFATMMNVEKVCVAVTRNVSDGINALAWAMPWKEQGDNVVICLDAEHPNNAYPWLRLKRRGVELRIVAPGVSGSLDTQAMIAAMDGNTRFLACPSVSFAPGYRTDLETLADACRARDVFLAVDGVQSAGILHHDFSAVPVSGFATSTSKGLLGLYGYGFLYVAPEWIDRLEPAYLSRPAVAMDGTGHSAMGSFDYTLQPDARRFEVGSYNVSGAYAADESLALLLGLGTLSIEARVLMLAAALRETLAGAGLEPIIAASGATHSHIVTVGRLDAGGHGFSDDPVITGHSLALAEAEVAHTIRRGQLRFGLHAYNTFADIARVGDVLVGRVGMSGSAAMRRG